MACGFRNLIYDIIEDVPVTNTLIGEFPNTTNIEQQHTPRGFVAEVQDAIRPEELDDDPINSVQKSCSMLPKDNNNMPIKSGLLHVPLSSDMLLCTMHFRNSCTPTDLQKGWSQGPWFQRTPSLNLTVDIPIDLFTRRTDTPTNYSLNCEDFLCSAKDACSKPSKHEIGVHGTKSTQKNSNCLNYFRCN